MEDRKQKLIEKIQKILIHAKDTEGTPEGDTFKRQAAILMTKYRIKETELDLEEANFIYDTFEFWADGKVVPEWVGDVVALFCSVFDGKNVYRKYHDRYEWEIFGTFSDVETILYFVEVVTAHIEFEAYKTWPQKTYRGKREQFGNAAFLTLYDRAMDLKNQMDQTLHEDENCTALVVKKAEEVSEAMHEFYPNLKYSKKRKRNLPEDKKTLSAGKKAGETAPLNFAIEEE